MVRVAKQFGVAYMQYMVMQELKLIEKHAKAAGLDITTEWATFRSSDVMNDALISGSVDFVSLGIPGIITIWSKTKGTPIEVKGVAGLNVSPLMLMVRDPAIKSIKDFKDNHRIALPAVKVSNAGDHAADGGREGIRRREIQRARSSHRVDVASGRDRRDARRAERDHGEFLLGAVPVPADEEPEHPPHPDLDGAVRRADVVQRHRGDVEIPQPRTRSSTRRSSPALKEATDFINADKRKGAEIYLKVTGEKTTVDDIMEVLADPAIIYNTKVGGIGVVRQLHGQDRHAEESAGRLEATCSSPRRLRGSGRLTSSS